MPYLRRLTAIILIVILSIKTAVNVYAEERSSTNLQLYAQSAVLMDAGSGRILYEKNGYECKPMASTPKIRTCILALEYGNLEDYVQVSSYAASMPKVKLGMQTGEYFKMEDLLYSLMLESHNDSAVAIAEHIGGSVEEFAEMMNQKARDIGCYDTYFITPNGLDASATVESGETKIHSTTAADLARIMSYCIMDSPKKEEFLQITRTASYQLNSYKEKESEYKSTGRSFSCNNHNAFLTMMDGALSGKTGFTGNAGYCYVGALEREGKTYVVALLACGWPNNKSYKWKDTKELMAYGLEHYDLRFLSEVAAKEESFLPIKVENGQTSSLGEVAYMPVEVVHQEKQKDEIGVLMREEEQFEVSCERKEYLKAPVEKGEEIGSIRYTLGDEVYRVDYLVAAENMDEIDLSWCIRQILHRYTGYNR